MVGEIKQKVHEIRNYVNMNMIIPFEFDEFKKKYPKLYSMIIKKDCDIYMLDKMLDCLEIQESQGQQKADEEFGRCAATRYIKQSKN